MVKAGVRRFLEITADDAWRQLTKEKFGEACEESQVQRQTVIPDPWYTPGSFSHTQVYLTDDIDFVRATVQDHYALNAFLYLLEYITRRGIMFGLGQA